MSRVVVVKHEAGMRGEAMSDVRYSAVLKKGLVTLTGETNESAGLKKLLPSGVIGMKANCLIGKPNSTPVPLTEALCGLLEEAGWKPKELVVWERSNRELQRAGFKLSTGGFGRRCIGTDTEGVGYGDEFHTFGESSSLVTRILEEIVTANINLPVLKDHSIAGLSGGLKNMFGAINNPNKFHSNNCDPHVAEVSMMEPIHSRNRLTIMDARRVQYQNGPGYDEGYLAKYGGVILSDDPVAADRVGLEIIAQLRSRSGLPTLEKAGRPARHLQTAARLGLGLADLAAIDLKVLVIDDQGRTRPGELL